MVSRRFAIGAVVGLAAGVIAGMLTAPKSGRETRADLKQRANDLKDKANDKAEHVTDKTEEYIERGQAAAKGAIEGAKKGFWSK